MGFDALFKVNTFAFTSVSALGQFSRFLDKNGMAGFRKKIHELRFYFFAKATDPVPMVSTYLSNLRKFDWITHLHFDFAALELDTWMMSTNEKKQEWLTMLVHFSERVTELHNALIYVTGFPDAA